MVSSLDEGSRMQLGISSAPALGDAALPAVACAGRTEVTRILIADQQTMFRDGVRALLESGSGFRVVGQADDGEEALRLAHELQPDVLLLELALPRIGGLDVLRELARVSVPVRKIVLAAEVDPSELVQAVQFGAQGMVLKRSGTQVLFDCIRTVMAGRYWVANENVSDLVQVLRRLLPPSGGRFPERALGLTPRELEVVRTVVAGYTNKEIAQKFSISEHTVKNHLTNVFDKLGVYNRLELALLAIEHRLSDLA
jgi:two-component system, NarL family, nitrate/nitrite response regulator NarL